MTEAIVGVISVLLGTALGFGLNEYAARNREARTERTQARSVRTILSLEIEENLRLLWQFWESVTVLPDDADRGAMNFSRRLIRVPLPGWSHKAWQSQLPSMATALKAIEVRRVHVHHSRLERITAIRDTLALSAAEQSEEWRSARGKSAGVPLHVAVFLPKGFDESAPELWPECERTVKEIMETGNPLPEESREISKSRQAKPAAR